MGTRDRTAGEDRACRGYRKPMALHLYVAEDTAVSAGATVVSNSWGGDESPETKVDDSHFGVKGVTYVFAAGDQGTPSYPATSPDVRASVGGTTLSHDANFNWTGESAWTGGGGGVSSLRAQARVPGRPDLRQAPPPTSPTMPIRTPALRSTTHTATVRPIPPDGRRSAGPAPAAPQWAALFAIANQGRAAEGKGSLDGVSQTLPALYAMTSDSSGTQLFDVVTGGKAPAQAGPGFDLVTGNGTPRKASNVVSYLVNLSRRPSPATWPP